MRYLIAIISFIVLSSVASFAQQKKFDDFIPAGGAKLMCQIEGGDTILLAFLHDVWVFPRSTFKNKKQEQFFWRTVRDVKRTLPYAKLIASELLKVNMEMAKMKT